MNTVKAILVVTLLNFTAGSLYAQYTSSLKLKNEVPVMKDSIKNTKRLSYKSPAIAGCLSFFVPGASLGQLYNEDYTSFAIHLGISAGLFMFAYIAGQTHLYELPPFYNEGGSNHKEGKREWIFLVCVLAYAGNWVWSTIDAIHYAIMNNREFRRQRKTGYNNIRLNFAPGIGRNNKPNLNILVYF